MHRPGFEPGPPACFTKLAFEALQKPAFGMEGRNPTVRLPMHKVS